MLDELDFKCLECDTKLENKVTEFVCPNCNTKYEVKGGTAVFGGVDGGDIDDIFDKIKYKIKKFRFLYNAIVYLISPVYFGNTKRKFIKQHIEGKEGVFLNIGSGNTEIHPQFINVDLFGYESVDIQCDITKIPLADNSVDVVYSESVLEHCPDPQAVIAEAYRVLKPDGIIYTDVPFMSGFHASPYDFNRWTSEGVKILHKDFEIEKVEINTGPTSALMWIFQEWFAILFSFGNKYLHLFFNLFIMGLTFPIKFLDAILRHYPTSINIASGFVLIGRKK